MTIMMKEVFRYFLRKINFIGMSLPLLILFGYKSDIANKPENTKPNIVLFVADDIGWHDVGYHGSEIKTPNIDNLAENGVELNQFYVYPTSSPSRAALLTGKYASRFGIGGPIAMRSKQVLPTNVETLPSILKANGYETAITGKWHLGLTPENGPNHYGFDYAYGYLHGQIDQYTHRYKNGDRTWHRNGEFIDEEGHATDLITNEALKYLSDIRNKENPFFLYVPFSVPHYPLQEEEKWIEPYKNLNDVESRKVFAAATAHMDYSIGKIMQYLRDNYLIENTLIIFISDNGGEENWYPEKETNVKLYDGKHGPYPKLGDNSPLKGFKTDLLEGGVRVPAIFYWKDHLKKNKVEQLLKVTDMLPTLASLVNNNNLNNLNLDGENIWDFISGEKSESENRVIYLRTGDQFSIREGDWKLIHYGKSLDEGKEELYNIKNDPNENINVIESNLKIRNELLDKLINQAKLDPAE